MKFPLSVCQIYCITEEEGLSSSVKPKAFTVAYDKLIIASGAQALTFNIHGVNNHAIFLREVSDAQAIRKKLLLNLMLSDIPGNIAQPFWEHLQAEIVK